MGRSALPHARIFRASLILGVVLLGTLAVPVAAAAASGPVESTIGGLPSTPTPFLVAHGLFSTASGSANEHNIASATSTAGAISATWQDTFYLNYTWTQTPGRPVVPVAQAILAIIYFGATVGSRTVVEETPITTNGSILMTTSYSQYQYLFGGLYGMTASLVAANGTTAWAQSFYISIGEPWDPTLIMIVLLIVIAYEIYSIVTCGRAERPARPKPTVAQPPPTSAPPGEPAAGPEATPPPGTGGQPYPSESPPPPGGS